MPTNTQTRQKRLFKNGAYSLLSWLFPLLPAFVVTPIVVKSLGNEIYGVYAVVLGFISYFFTFGIGKAAAKYIAEYRASGETEKISDIISSTIILSYLLGIIGILAVSLSAKIIVTDVLRISQPLQDTAVTALYLACAHILLLMLMQIFQFVLQGLQRFDRYLMLTNLNSLLLNLGIVLLALNGYGVIALLIWTLIAACFICILSVVVALKLLPEFRFSITVSRGAWQAVWRYALSIIAYQIFGNILLLFERGWIMRKFGAEALTYYAVPMTLGIYIQTFTTSLVFSTFPMVNELLAEKEKLVTLYKKSTKLILMLVVFAVVSVVVEGKLFLGLWMNDEFARMSYLLLVTHVFTFSLLAVFTIAWQVAEGFRYASLNAVATFVWMVISILLMVILADQFESVGVAVARFAGCIVFIPLILYVEKRFLSGIFWKFWGGMAARILLASTFTYMSEWLILSYLPREWPAFLASVFVGLVTYVAVLVICGFFDADDRQIIRNLLVRSS